MVQAQFYLRNNLNDQPKQVINILAKQRDNVSKEIVAILKKLNIAESDHNIKEVVALRRELQQHVTDLSHERVFNEYYSEGVVLEDQIGLTSLCLKYALEQLFQKKARTPIQGILQDSRVQSQIQVMSRAYKDALLEKLRVSDIRADWLLPPEVPAASTNIRGGRPALPAAQLRQEKKKWFSGNFDFSEDKVIECSEKVLPFIDASNIVTESVRLYYILKGRYSYKVKKIW